MILDECRFLLEIKSLSVDIQDTMIFWMEKIKELEQLVEDDLKTIQQKEADIQDLKRQNVKLQGQAPAPKSAIERYMKSKFNSHCVLCKGPIAEGEDIRWNPTDKARHLEGKCHE